MTSFHHLLVRAKSRLAFTLIEMLVVVMVVGLVVAAIAPMVFDTLSSTRLTSAGETLAAHISLAKQMALSRNQTVQVRFYSYQDAEVPGSNDVVRAFAIMRVGQQLATTAAAGAVVMEPLAPIFYFPSGIVGGSSTALSPILTGSLLTTLPDTERVIKRSTNARYKAFTFGPDGTPNLEGLMGSYRPNLSYLTLVEERAGGSGAQIPKNFYSLQIDPATGKTSSYRP